MKEKSRENKISISILFFVIIHSFDWLLLLLFWTTFMNAITLSLTMIIIAIVIIHPFNIKPIIIIITIMILHPLFIITLILLLLSNQTNNVPNRRPSWYLFISIIIIIFNNTLHFIILFIFQPNNLIDHLEYLRINLLILLTIRLYLTLLN